MPLVVYGVPLSQPVRAVLWALAWKRVPFQLVPVNPGSTRKGGTRHPEFLKRINPSGTMPAIDDEGFCLGESHAILTYLAEKHGWSDLYPSDLKTRAKIDEYLHFHHSNTRQGSLLFAKKVRPDLKLSEGAIRNAKNIAKKTVQILESTWLGNGNMFLVGDNPTIADLAAYSELGQHSASLSNTAPDIFEGAPKTIAWMERCAELPGHDAIHLALKQLGDLSSGPPNMKRVVAANKKGIHAISKL